MRRNIYLTFDEYTEIRKELGIKRKRCKYTNQMEDEYWNFYLSPYDLKNWKRYMKANEKYDPQPDETGHCFERVGVFPSTFNKLKSQYLINRLCEEQWRSHDLNAGRVFQIEHEYNFHYFLGWIFNAHLKEELDKNTSREELYRIWEIMSNTIQLTSKTRWFQWDLENLADEVIVSVCKQTLEA